MYHSSYPAFPIEPKPRPPPAVAAKNPARFDGTTTNGETYKAHTIAPHQVGTPLSCEYFCSHCGYGLFQSMERMQDCSDGALGCRKLRQSSPLNVVNTRCTAALMLCLCALAPPISLHLLRLFFKWCSSGSQLCLDGRLIPYTVMALPSCFVMNAPQATMQGF